MDLAETMDSDTSDRLSDRQIQLTVSRDALETRQTCLRRDSRCAEDSHGDVEKTLSTTASEVHDTLTEVGEDETTGSKNDELDSKTASSDATEMIRESSRPRSWLDIDDKSSDDEQDQSPQPRTGQSSSLHRSPVIDLSIRASQSLSTRSTPDNGGQDESNLTALPKLPEDDPWTLPPLPCSPLPSRKRSIIKPQPSLANLSSLDNLLRFKEEKEEWKRASLVDQQVPPLPQRLSAGRDIQNPRPAVGPIEKRQEDMQTQSSPPNDEIDHPILETSHQRPGRPEPKKFRHLIAEIGFCFTIAMTQFLTEYLISGFAIELSKLPSLTPSSNDKSKTHPESMGIFWPASLLSLVLSAMLLIFARLSDMYGGYSVFMTGIAWLGIWTLIPGFTRGAVMIDTARAMQGLAIAAFMPATFALVGSVYPEGRRRNFVLGLYSGCAPLGFFGGLFVAAALPEEMSRWYFWIAAILASVTFLTAFLTVPSDRTDREKLNLKMDWIGAFLITGGLLLVSYALSVEPYASSIDTPLSGFRSPMMFGPLISGIVALIVAFWYEGWRASCPLLPFDFFKPKSAKAFSVACLCFYASYGAWLYNSVRYFESLTEAESSGREQISGMTLAFWYLPTAVGGVILCVIGGSLMHIVPVMALLVLSGLAWIAAPLLLALAPLPLQYWGFVMPSMVCATLGIDLTFTISIVFLSSVQPLKYQGLTGAVCSSLVNLGMSFALSLSEIVSMAAESSFQQSVQGSAPSSATSNAKMQQGFKAALIYAAVSAGMGLAISIVYVRISRSAVTKKLSGEERSQIWSIMSRSPRDPAGDDSSEQHPRDGHRNDTKCPVIACGSSRRN